jgi:hypothetical protein
MKLWHTALLVVLVFACIWASNHVSFIQNIVS